MNFSQMIIYSLFNYFLNGNINQGYSAACAVKSGRNSGM